jgi:hypothetical protein
VVCHKWVNVVGKLLPNLWANMTPLYGTGILTAKLISYSPVFQTKKIGNGSFRVSKSLTSQPSVVSFGTNEDGKIMPHSRAF